MSAALKGGCGQGPVGIIVSAGIPQVGHDPDALRPQDLADRPGRRVSEVDRLRAPADGRGSMPAAPASSAASASRSAT